MSADISFGENELRTSRVLTCALTRGRAPIAPRPSGAARGVRPVAQNLSTHRLSRGSLDRQAARSLSGLRQCPAVAGSRVASRPPRSRAGAPARIVWFHNGHFIQPAGGAGTRGSAPWASGLPYGGRSKGGLQWRRSKTVSMR